jgi:uncharacterized Zn-finger protein
MESDEWMKAQTVIPIQNRTSSANRELTHERNEFNAACLNTNSADLDVSQKRLLELKEETEQPYDDEFIPEITGIEKAKRVAKSLKNPQKTHMCSVCGKTFSTPGHLRSHELIHNDSKDFTCLFCEKKFLTKSYLNRHMKSHINERNYKCKVCQKGFNTSTTLGYHFRLVHSGEP